MPHRRRPEHAVSGDLPVASGHCTDDVTCSIWAPIERWPLVSTWRPAPSERPRVVVERMDLRSDMPGYGKLRRLVTGALVCSGATFAPGC